MASVPHNNYYCDNYVFAANNNNELCELPTPMSVGTDGSTGSEIQSEEIVPYYDNGVVNMVPYDSDITSSMMSIAAALPEYERGIFGVAGTEHGHGLLAAGYHQHEEFVDECINIGFSSNFWPAAYPNMNAENWAGGRLGLQNKVEDPNLKITRYSAEERKDRILRYLKKRSQRNFNKTIKYACRKTLADKRVRIRGRFAKNNNDICTEDDESVMKTDQTFQDNPLQQIKAQEEEYWLQEAISNLMYYHHIFPDNSSMDLIP